MADYAFTVFTDEAAWSGAYCGLRADRPLDWMRGDSTDVERSALFDSDWTGA